MSLKLSLSVKFACLSGKVTRYVIENKFARQLFTRYVIEAKFAGQVWLTSLTDKFDRIFVFAKIPYIIICLAVISYVIEANQVCPLSLSAKFAGQLHGFYMLLCNRIGLHVHCQINKQSKFFQVTLALDEEIIEFDSIFGPKTWTFLFPRKRVAINILIHSLVVGVTTASVIYYLSPSQYNCFYVPWEIQLTFTVFGAGTLGIGVWPLLVGAPPEPATFHPLPWDLATLSRAVHMLVAVAVHALSCYFSEISALFMLNVVVHVLFVVCPVLWVLGILPPIDAFFLWILEQWLVIILGGSQMSSNGRLIIQTVFGTLTLLMTAAIPYTTPILIFAALRGQVLSIDTGWLFFSILSSRSEAVTGIIGKYSDLRPVKGFDKSLRRITCFRESVLYLVIVAGILALSFAIHLPQHEWYIGMENGAQNPNVNKTEWEIIEACGISNSDLPSVFQRVVLDTIGGLVLLFLLTVLIINAMQKIYIFGIFRNPFFKRTGDAATQSDFLFYVTQFMYIGSPFVCLVYVHLIIGANIGQQLSAAGSQNSLSWFLLTVPLVRVYRQIWQFPHASLLQLSIFFILDILHERCVVSLGLWADLAPSLRIFIITLGWIWACRLLERLSTAVVISLTSITEDKQRKPISFCLLGFNLAMFPFLLGLFGICSIMSAPLLPLFTLPFFLMGFPRPLRFWPYPVGRASNSCHDSVYYEQLTPHIIFSVHNLVQSGAIGLVFPGEHFLLRWEDRFLWIQILEVGYTYVYYSVKGLELQETSCHTAEASTVDSIFSRAFDTDVGIQGSQKIFNPFMLHTLTPFTKIVVPGYSDTRNVLTGVIDSPDTLGVVHDYFYKSFIYVLLEYLSCRKQKSAQDQIFTEDDNRNVRLGSAKNRESHDLLRSLPKVAKNLENHFEDNGTKLSSISDSTDKEINVSSAEGSKFSRVSVSGRSGRGSRMAWVEEWRIDLPIPLGDLSPPSSWDDDDDPLDSKTTKNPRKVSTLPPIVSKAQNYLMNFQEEITEVNYIPGMYDSQEEDDNDNLFPIQHSGNTYKSNQVNMISPRVNVRIISQSAKNRRSPVYNSSLSTAMAPLSQWMSDIPYQTDVLDEIQDLFPHAWFKFILDKFGRKYLSKKNTAGSRASSAHSSKEKPQLISYTREEEELLQTLQKDDMLEETFRLVIAACHLVLHGVEAGPPTSSQVTRTYLGEVPWSMALDWLQARATLNTLVLKAYRMAVKLSLDHTLIGPITNMVELQACLQDYSQNWFLGPDNQDLVLSDNRSRSRDSDELPSGPQTWAEAVRMEMPNLFSLGYNSVKGVHTSHLLTMGRAEVCVGRLAGETVRAIWASLATELLYLTNDDDERYSIQAHPVVLRNLTIQAADPPLGYPIFSSPPIRLGTPWLSATYQHLLHSQDD
ncbi:unnamed protein product, partial [Meganyctiphanes norvegica]